MEILSYPGPVPPVNSKIIRTQKRIVAREYRNRRIGDLLKELHLTEGRGTGFPTIYNAMEVNGSPIPRFDSDDESSYFLVTLPVHDAWSNGASNGANDLLFNNLEELIAFSNGASNGASNQGARSLIEIISSELHDRVPEMLSLLIKKMSRKDLFEATDLSNQTKNRVKYLDPLINAGWIEMEYPNERTHPNQTYNITDSGKRILNFMTRK